MPTFRILPGPALRQASSKRNSHECATSEHAYLASGPGGLQQTRRQLLIRYYTFRRAPAEA